MQIEELEAQLESAMSDSKRQVAVVQQRAAEAVRNAEVAAARGGAEAVAGSVEREAAMHRSLSDLRAELEVSPGCVECNMLAFEPQYVHRLAEALPCASVVQCCWHVLVHLMGC